MRRRAIVGLRRKMDEAERVLAAAQKSYAEAVLLFREGCPHPNVFEIRVMRSGHGARISDAIPYTDAEYYVSVHRFCLSCGDTEVVAAGKLPDFVRFKDIKPFRVSSYGFDSRWWPKDLGHLRERLHLQARFDEFDDQGNWRGEGAHSIVRGRD